MPRRSAQAWILRCHRSRKRTLHVKWNPAAAGDHLPFRFRIGQRNRAGSKLTVTKPQAEDRKERKNGAMADPAFRKARRDHHRAYGKDRAAKREARSPQELSRPPSDPFCSGDGIGPVLFRSPFVSEKNGAPPQSGRSRHLKAGRRARPDPQGLRSSAYGTRCAA